VVATPDPLPSEPDALRAIIAAQAAELAAKDAELRSERTLTEKLKAQLALLRRARFGASSEKIDRAIEQLELALDQIEAAELQETGKVLLVEKRAGSGRSARLPLPDHLPREEVVHAASCVCPECGSDRLRKSGEIVTEVLDYVPASFRVVRHVQPRHLCLTCDAVVTTAMPSLPIERGKPGPGLVAHVLVAKFCDHLPLYRQSEIYAREGVEIARSTLADWIGRAAWLMEPLVEAVRAHVFAGARLHGDDTPMPVLEPGRGQTKRGRLWTYVRDERPWQSPASPAVCYFYSADRKAMHPQAHLKGYSGVLHADAYADLPPFGWTRLACQSLLGLLRCDVPERGMDPLPIVVALHIREEVTPGLVLGRPLPLVHEFHLQGVKEALHRGIIIAVAGPAHRGLHPGPREELPVLTRGVLPAAIGVMGQTRTGALPLDCHQKGGFG
jgi:transposase